MSQTLDDASNNHSGKEKTMVEAEIEVGLWGGLCSKEAPARPYFGLR
jgi:hypothetical protein